MKDNREELPDPDGELTWPEKWLARRLTPYRIFWMKRILNLVIIAAFLWAAYHFMEMRGAALQVEQAINQSGCSVLIDPETGKPLPPGEIQEGLRSGNISQYMR